MEDRNPFPVLVMVLAGMFLSFPEPVHAAPSVEVSSASLGGLCSLTVQTSVRGVTVTIDRQYRGITPLEVTGLSPGAHSLVLTKTGYREEVVSLTLAPDTLTKVVADMQQLTGYLNVHVDPDTAIILIDKKEYSPGIIELPVGPADVRVRAFGYVDQTFSVTIHEKFMGSMDISLETADFSAGSFKLSRDRFNPRNAGIRGTVDVAFTVTAPGTATATVSDAAGKVIARQDLKRFDDWVQSYAWNGLDSDGRTVPDGGYTVSLVVIPDKDVESEKDEYLFTAPVVVDTSMVIIPQGSWGVISGSQNAPSGGPVLVGGIRLDSSVLAAGTNTGWTFGSFAMSASVLLPGIGEAGIGLDFGADGMGSAILGIRVVAPGRATGMYPLVVSGVLEGRLDDASSGNPSWIRAGPVLGAGSHFMNVTLATTAAAWWEEGFSVRSGVHAALTASGYAAGVSMSVGADSGAGELLPGWPLKSALEARLTPGNLPLSLRLIGGLDWYPEPTAWYVGGGLSIDL